MKLKYDVAKNGLAAKNIYQQNWIQGFGYPLILMDLVMPIKNGYETTK